MLTRYMCNECNHGPCYIEISWLVSPTGIECLRESPDPDKSVWRKVNANL